MPTDHVSIFTDCVPSGDITILNVQQGGDVLNDDWNLHVNGDWLLQSGLDNGMVLGQVLDARKIARGKDGKLFLQEPIRDKNGAELLPGGTFLGDVPTFSATFRPTNATYLPAGSEKNLSIRQAYDIEITLTKTKVTDAMLKALHASIPAPGNESPPELALSLRGTIKGR